MYNPPLWANVDWTLKWKSEYGDDDDDDDDDNNNNKNKERETILNLRRRFKI
jgi:hypothetical protein